MLTSPSSVGRVMLAAGRDLYEQAARLIPANLLWGITAVGWVSLLLVWPPLLVLVATPVLFVPLVAVFRLAASIARGFPVTLSAGITPIRAYAAPAILTGTVVSLAVVACATYIAFGIGFGGLVGGGIAALGAWGLIATALLALTFLPLVADPNREAQSLRRKLRLAGLVILAAPGRAAGFGIVVVVILMVSTIAFPALLSVSVAFSACVASRAVLPVADRLDVPLSEGGHADHG